MKSIILDDTLFYSERPFEAFVVIKSLLFGDAAFRKYFQRYVCIKSTTDLLFHYYCLQKSLKISQLKFAKLKFVSYTRAKQLIGTVGEDRNNQYNILKNFISTFTFYSRMRGMANEILHFSIAQIYTPTFLARKLNFTQLRDIPIRNAIRRLDCHVSLFIRGSVKSYLNFRINSRICESRDIHISYITRATDVINSAMYSGK